MVPVNNRSWPASFSCLSLSHSLLASVPLLSATQKACWGDSKVDGSRELHGILMVVERAREEGRWSGWMG